MKVVLQFVHSTQYIFNVMGGTRGEDRGPDPTRPVMNHKFIGFLGNTGPELLINHKATNIPSQNSMLCHHRHASEMPFKWRFAGGSMMAHFY